MTQSESLVFHFGDLTLDTAMGRLTGAAGDVDLRPKSFALLCYLVQHSGRVLSKDELIAAVWPDVTVTDDSLTRCVHEVRRSLGPAGERLLRTIPRRGYLFEGRAADATGTVTTLAPVVRENGDARPVRQGSVAVMPLACLPPMTPEDEQMFDGLVNDVISYLARLRSFHVIARGSTFALRQMATDPMRLRALLNVAYMVSGSVEPRGTGFRLRIDLVQTLDGMIVWTDEMMIRDTGIIGMIGTLTERIVNTIASEITAAERLEAKGVPDRSLDAWQAYHRGMDHVFRFDAQQMALAQGYFESATRLDPGFARAHAATSFCHYFFAFSNLCGDRDAEKQAALRSAGRAMQADDGNPTSHWAYGRALWLNGDPEGGLTHSRRAVRLSPGFAHAHYMIGFIEAHHGDPQRAMEALARAEALSPFDPFLGSVQITRGIALVRLGDLEQAAVWARKAARHPNAYSQIQGAAALILAGAGHLGEGREIVAGIGKGHPGYDLSVLLGALYGLPEDVAALFRKTAPKIGL